MKSWIIAITIAITAFLFAGCHPAKSETLSSALLDECMEKEGQMTLVVAVGDELTIPLVSNPTTGFLWSVTVDPADSVKLISEEFKAPDSKLAGAPGEQIYTFIPQKIGKATLNFEYSRSWEKEVPPARTFVMELDAR